MKPLAISCEGKADKKFICNVLDHLNLDKERVNFYPMAGKPNFFNPDYEQYQDTLKYQVETALVKKMLFIIDADDTKKDQVYGGFDNTLRHLTQVIQQLGFSTVSEIFISCDPQIKTGSWESLILSTLPQKQQACIQDFLACSEFKSKENHKAIIHQLYETAYPNTPYNFAHPHFDELKTKLTWLFAENSV